MVEHPALQPPTRAFICTSNAPILFPVLMEAMVEVANRLHILLGHLQRVGLIISYITVPGIRNRMWHSGLYCCIIVVGAAFLLALSKHSVYWNGLSRADVS